MSFIAKALAADGTLGKDFTSPDGVPEVDNAWYYVTNIVNFFISLIGVIAVVYIIYQGFRYLIGQADDAKQKIIYALIGLIIIIVAYTAVSFVTGGQSFLFNQSAQIGESKNEHYWCERQDDGNWNHDWCNDVPDP